MQTVFLPKWDKKQRNFSEVIILKTRFVHHFSPHFALSALLFLNVLEWQYSGFLSTNFLWVFTIRQVLQHWQVCRAGFINKLQLGRAGIKRISCVRINAARYAVQGENHTKIALKYFYLKIRQQTNKETLQICLRKTQLAWNVNH